MWETEVPALAWSSEQPGSAGMGGAQSAGAGDVFGEVRVSGLVTMTIRAKEKHLNTQTCAHLTHVGQQGFCC